MKIKLKPSLLLKKDAEGKGVLFSAEDENENYIKLSGIALVVIEKLMNRQTTESVIEEIMAEYEVTSDLLNSDLEMLLNKLKDANFIINE